MVSDFINTDQCAKSLITSTEKENKTAGTSFQALYQLKVLKTNCLLSIIHLFSCFFWLVGWQRRVLVSTKLVSCKIFVRDVRLLKRFVNMVRELHRPS